MAHAAKVTTTTPIDISRARLVRRGPGRPVSLSLRSMREAAGLTQAQVSKRSGLAQPEISKIEAATSFDDRQVSTLRRYLAALGDDLDLVSVSKYGHRIGVAGAHASGSSKPANGAHSAEVAHQQHASASLDEDADALRATQLIDNITQARALLLSRIPQEADRCRRFIRQCWQALVEKDDTRKAVRLDVLRSAIEQAEEMRDIGSKPGDAKVRFVPAVRAFFVDGHLRRYLSGVDPKPDLIRRAVELWPSRRGVWAALGALARDIGINASDKSLKAMWMAKPTSK